MPKIDWNSLLSAVVVAVISVVAHFFTTPSASQVADKVVNHPAFKAGK